MLASFSIVANQKYAKEVTFCIYSIRSFYQTPILLYCDEHTKNYVNRYKFQNIFFRICTDEEDLKKITRKVASVKRHNSFHSPEYIYLKMDAMKEAIDNFGNTLFVDSDIVIARDIIQDINKSEVILSPHYHEKKYRTNSINFGIFNAGYIYASNPEVAESWRHIYLNESAFYEQEGMWRLMRLYNFNIFPKTHNVGFWRFQQIWENKKIVQSYMSGCTTNEVKSWHFHIDESTYENANNTIKKGYKKVYDEIILSLPYHMKMFLKELK